VAAVQSQYHPFVSPSSLPGGDLIAAGIHALERGDETIAALLVSIGAPRLRRLGFAITSPFPDPEARLTPCSLRPTRRARMVGSTRIERFMEALGREARARLRVYLVTRPRSTPGRQLAKPLNAPADGSVSRRMPLPSAFMTWICR
jgi:hypothetical protein